jgi:Icc-related predicted phosphoesterase
MAKDHGVIYLEDSMIEIDGYKIFGSPWSPVFKDWAFMMEEHRLARVYERIPEVDILITHTPPQGILDPHGFGSSALYEEIWRIKPQYHIFGHNHDGYGILEKKGTTFINASLCDAPGPGIPMNLVNIPLEVLL